MRDEQDPAIRRLFAEQKRSSASDDFMLQLGKRIEAHERARRTNMILAIVACLILSILIVPWIAQGTSMLIDLTVEGLGTGGPLLRAPLTWLVAAGTAAGFSPVIYLWRTGRW